MQRRWLTPNRFLFLSLALALLFSLPAMAAKEQTLTILQTSDLHGHVMPVDYFTGKTEDGGLAQIATLVKVYQQAEPNLLLLDCGDTIEGGNSVLPWHYQFQPKLANPMAVAMNQLPYAAMAVGNHEFNYGLTTLSIFRQDLNFPLVSANILGVDDRPYFEPYVIKQVGEVKVAVLGLTTPKIPVWEKPENIPGLKFLDPVETARRYVPELRKKADVVVILAHTGPEKAPKDTRDPANWAKAETYVDQQQNDENFLFRLAAIPGVDVVLGGHAHLSIPGVQNLPGINEGALVVEPGYWGKQLAKVDLTLRKPLFGRWQIVEKSAELLSVNGVANDEDMVKAIKPYHDATTNYYTSPVGQITADVPGGLKARFGDTPLVALINRAQLWATGADISLAALFTEASQFKKGGVSIRDIYGLYIYPNTLYKIQVTGKQLREALEQDARYFKTLTPEIKTFAEAVDPQVRGYNWDIYMGIKYTIDLSRPAGQRVTELKFKGRDVQDDDTFTLAVNNYRAGGGGGFTMFKDAPVLWKSEKEVREIIVDYVKQLPNQTIDVQSLTQGDFTLAPAEAIASLK
ncbi:MAG TPA: bifunctional metallophosphatase/5'-nucleotidase [Firmicutes bacterium]|nr:bifunctional metallophosphatase/5'-nucleotidase [Bacillota bacterium]